MVERRPKTFTVLVGEKLEVVPEDRLKLQTGQGLLQPAELLRRGRPQRSATSSSNAIAEGGYIEIRT
jgi:hypothetical protein